MSVKYPYLLLSFTLLLSSCHISKLVSLYTSKNHRKPKFDKDIVKPSPDTVFRFAKGRLLDSLKISQLRFDYIDQDGETNNLDFETYFKTMKTTAFLVLKNDTILYERYFKNNNENTLLPSFSIAKSFTAALVGIAVQEGFIKNVQEPITNYLPELVALHPNWQLLTIEHLLEMKSGIYFEEGKKYYKRPKSDVNELLLTKDVFAFIKEGNFVPQPDLEARDDYSSLDAQLLGLVLEIAINKPIATYLEEKIWQPLGMESEAYWALDSRESGHTKTFCCMQARARDYARFALLYLNKGNWNGQQIIEESWVLKSFPENNGRWDYDYYWWGGSNHFRAVGAFGQEISIAPEADLIFIRFGVRSWKGRDIFGSSNIRNMVEVIK